MARYFFPAEQQPEAAARKTIAGQGQGRATSRRTTDYSNRITAEAVGKPRRRQPRVPEAPWVKSPRSRLRRAPPNGSTYRTVIPPLGGGIPFLRPREINYPGYKKVPRRYYGTQIPIPPAIASTIRTYRS